jgi:hypothetical protein
MMAEPNLPIPAKVRQDAEKTVPVEGRSLNSAASGSFSSGVSSPEAVLPTFPAFPNATINFFEPRGTNV